MEREERNTLFPVSQNWTLQTFSSSCYSTFHKNVCFFIPSFPNTHHHSVPPVWHALEVRARCLSRCVAASWLIGSSRSDCVNLKSLFSPRFYFSPLGARRNIGFSCEKYTSQQASLCHFSVISVWYPEGGLNCDMNGGNELICSAEPSVHLNVTRLVPVSVKWSSFFCLICGAYLSARVCVQFGVALWANSPWMLGRSGPLLAPSGLLPWWSHLRVNNSKLTGSSPPEKAVRDRRKWLVILQFLQLH